MNQPLFHDGGPPLEGYTPRPRGPGYAETPQETFERFHRRNPEVYAELLAICQEYRAGELELGVAHPRWSIWAAIQVLRWERHKKRLPDISISNNHTTFFARLLTRDNPELEGFFALHETKHAEGFA